MNRSAQSVVVLLVGGAILRISITDQYQWYVKPGLRPFLLLAGGLLVAVALATLWHETVRHRRPATPVADEFAVAGSGSEHGHGDDGGDGHGGDGHGHHHEPRVAWLLILPVLALLLVAPPPLGSFAASNSGTALSANAESDFPALPGEDSQPAKLSVLDYASRAVFDDGRSLGKHKVLLTGFITRGAHGEQFLTRMILTCCAADARPIKIGMAGSVPAGLKPDTWIEVTGVYSKQTAKDDVNNESIPYVEVESTREVPVPKRVYE